MDVVDDYHGTKVADPYRWLEDPDSPRTRAWIEAENVLSRSVLDAIPERPAILARLTEVWNHERFGVPAKRAGRIFFTRNDGLQPQAILYVADGDDGEPRVLVDPNPFSADGTVALAEFAPSPDGRLLAYEVSDAGSDWTTVRVRDVATGRDLDDRVAWTKFSGLAWRADRSGFYYSTYPDHDTTGNVALKHHRLMLHRLGTPQASDPIVCERPDEPDFGFGGTVTADGTLLVIHVWKGTETKNRVYLQDLTVPDAPIVRLLDDFDAAYDFLGKRGEVLYFRTDLDAPRGRVIAIERARPERASWREIVPEAEETLEVARLTAGGLVAAYLKDAASVVRAFEDDGRLVETLALPAPCSVAELRGSDDDPEAFFAVSSFVSPVAVWRYDAAARRTSVFREPKAGFDAGRFTTEQVFFPSRDGTRVPMFLVRRKDLAPCPATPALLYGYGGFNVPMTPSFSPANLVWVERGGLYAVPCLRGGGEYGRAWHEAGTKERKQNVFDDCIAAAEWLVARGWTSPAKLAIRGRSNGGLLVGACLTQRPNLFGAALPGVGVLDMLRYHRFTIGWAWASDYGTADDPEAFAYLRRYSPLHNVRAGTRYPATLITTADHDDRVVPAHSFKFAAALQAAQGGPAPILIRIETRAGHGPGKPTAMQIDQTADEWAFLAQALR
jgi:prolyl oligopeptidase